MQKQADPIQEITIGTKSRTTRKPTTKPSRKSHPTNNTEQTVCPSCSNMLIITTLPTNHCTPSDAQAGHGGKNRFECRTCPYQMVLDRRYFERKTMKLKAVEDILGGADSWANVDRTDGKLSPPCLVASSFLPTSKSPCDGISMLLRNFRTGKADIEVPMKKPNAPMKAAILVWRTSDRCKFAAPMSR
jgi:hypothetical protein